MVRTEEKVFKTTRGDAVISVTQLTAIRAGKLLMRIKTMIGPALVSLALAEQKADAGGVAEAAKRGLEGLTGDELESLTKELLQGGSCMARVNGDVIEVWPNFDALFTDHLDQWFSLLWFALTVNYGNFIGAVGGLLPKLPMGTATASKVTAIFSGPPKG
jgi:hypothetical protein